MSERPLPSVAALFDFDDTLCPDTTSTFLACRGVDRKVFWDEVAARVSDGYDYCLAYLDVFTGLVRPGLPLDGLKREDLRAFGRTVVPYAGVAELLGDLRRLGEEKGVQVRLYVLSSGLREVIEASPVGALVDAVYASELGPDETGCLRRVKRAVSFTEKTRYVFEVHKGLPWEETRTNPLRVNKAVEHRPVPFERMIFVGDGLTDIPCFALVRKFGGLGIAVDQTKEHASKAKREILKKLACDRRVVAAWPPEYEDAKPLGRLLRSVVRSYVELVAAERDPAEADGP